MGVTAPLTFFAPKRPFGTFRCCAWLIFRQSPTGALTPKRACFSRGAAYEGGAKKPLRRCGASSPYTGEPRKRRNLSLPCVRGGGSAKPRRRGCVLPPRSFLLLAQSLLNGEVDEGADGREMAADVGVGDAENLQAVALQESGVLGVAGGRPPAGRAGSRPIRSRGGRGHSKNPRCRNPTPFGGKSGRDKTAENHTKGDPPPPKGWERYFGSFLPQRRQKAKPSSAGAPQ